MDLVLVVVFFIVYGIDIMVDGFIFFEVCKRLEEVGVDVVGLNCGRGLRIMMLLIKEIWKVCKVLFLLKFID